MKKYVLQDVYTTVCNRVYSEGSSVYYSIQVPLRLNNEFYLIKNPSLFGVYSLIQVAF